MTQSPDRSLPRQILSLALAGMLTAVVVARPSVAGAAARAMPIAAARQKALGSTVTVRGTVTVPTGAFDGGFALQQAQAGLYVLDSGGANRNIGDEVLVTGTLVDNYGVLSIQPTSVAALGHEEPIEPQRRATGSVGEASESRLLALHGTQVGDLVDDSPYGWKIDIDDGSGPIQIFIYPGSGIDVSNLKAGARIDVTCYSSQYTTTYECAPPTAGDLRVH